MELPLLHRAEPPKVVKLIPGVVGVEELTQAVRFALPSLTPPHARNLIWRGAQVGVCHVRVGDGHEDRVVFESVVE